MDTASTKIVRYISLKGADRDIKDNEGRQPIDLIEEVSIPNLRKELKKILGPPKFFDFLQLKPPTRLIYRSALLPIV